MASYKNFSQKRRATQTWAYNNTDNPLSYDPINSEKLIMKNGQNSYHIIDII